MDFQLHSVPLLSRIGADRADQVRTDVDAAAAGWADAALLRLDSRNQVMVADGRVVLGSAKAFADKPPPDAVFLGRLEDGRDVERDERAQHDRDAPVGAAAGPQVQGQALVPGLPGGDGHVERAGLAWCERQGGRRDRAGAA